ncbi:MAG: AAA family ATPase [Ktedonobacteraceae bacterium]
MEVYLEEEALRDMTSLYIMCGLSYAGKSTLSKALVDRFGFSLVGLDEINTERGIGLQGEPISWQEWGRTYIEAYKRIGHLLSQGKSVIYDAANFTREQRDKPKEIAQKHRALTKVIYVNVPKDEAIRRWQQNKHINTRFDVREEDFAHIADNFQAPTEDEDVIVYDNSLPLNKWIELYFY